jgi:hypothetical protein
MRATTVNQFLQCPSDCLDFDFGVLDEDQDCTSYDLEFSQVCGLIFLPNAAPLPTDWTSPSDWEEVIDNELTNNSKGRYIIGSGEVPVPEKFIGEYPKKIRRVLDRRYTVRMEVVNLSNNQYEFIRLLQCGDLKCRIWIETVGGLLFGGPSGIVPSLIDGDLPLSSDRNGKEFGTTFIQFFSDGDPDRAAVDLTGVGVDTGVPAIGDPDQNFIIGDPSSGFGIF